MIKVKCAYCGRIYEAPTKRSVYCSDCCRIKAYKERARKEKKKLMSVSKVSQSTQRFVPVEDPARALVEVMRKYGKYSREYWNEFQKYELTRDPDSKAFVNDVSVHDPNFVDSVMYAISADNKVMTFNVSE